MFYNYFLFRGLVTYYVCLLNSLHNLRRLESLVKCEVSPDLSEKVEMPLRVLNQICQILVIRCQRPLTFFSSP